MSLFDAVIQGIIQGLTEFLPVSSSGHLSVYQHFAGVSQGSNVLTTVMLHLGTLVAVVIAFHKKIISLIKEFFLMFKDIFTGKFKWSEMNADRRMIFMIIISILPLFGFYVFRHIFTKVSEDNDIIVEGVCFLYTSAILFIGSYISKKNEQMGRSLKTTLNMNPVDAIVIGIFQGIALLPGVSRSGSTISGAQIIGMKREDSVEYSFILGIPVIMAGALSELMDAGAEDAVTAVSPVPIIVGMMVAGITGYFAIILIKWLMKSDRFTIFSIYTLILGLAVLAAGIYENVTDTFLYDIF
ncbi:MAG: undecaprenyl-diphosphate phosphatase [Oscillospiraceae bacterium]|nr:undecaprenyl-diphosphate phosphatase [Oscillospiraceae bacterium]